jgi:hypothetical protein
MPYNYDIPGNLTDFGKAKILRTLVGKQDFCDILYLKESLLDSPYSLSDTPESSMTPLIYDFVGTMRRLILHQTDPIDRILSDTESVRVTADKVIIANYKFLQNAIKPHTYKATLDTVDEEVAIIPDIYFQKLFIRDELTNRVDKSYALQSVDIRYKVVDDDRFTLNTITNWGLDLITRIIINPIGESISDMFIYIGTGVPDLSGNTNHLTNLIHKQVLPASVVEINGGVAEVLADVSLSNLHPDLYPAITEIGLGYETEDGMDYNLLAIASVNYPLRTATNDPLAETILFTINAIISFSCIIDYDLIKAV